MENWRNKLHEIIFEAETPLGKFFDLGLIVTVILSVIVVMLESIESVHRFYSTELVTIEWIFTIIFTFEYFLRIISVHKPTRYMFSFFGLVDFFSILPTYLSLLFPGAQGLIIIRILRLLRIFRVLKLHRFTTASKILLQALVQSRHKIIVFLTTVLTLVFILGAVMYLLEGRQNGFDNIPLAVYWAVVTITTVGYGDIVPHTAAGQFISSLLMIIGYGILAVPTGIISVEIANVSKSHQFTRFCQSCNKEGHEVDALYCSNCGAKL